MTGEFDYSCTPDMTLAVAAAIPGSRATVMKGIGHFPMIENYPLFREYPARRARCHRAGDHMCRVTGSSSGRRWPLSSSLSSAIPAQIPTCGGMCCSAGTCCRPRASRRPDPYSFTSDRMRINHEWLAECVMYLAFAIGGGTGLVVLKMLVVLATVGLVWSELRRQQVDSATRDLLIALTVVGTFPQANHVRPQIFSIVAFAILLGSSSRVGRFAACC